MNRTAATVLGALFLLAPSAAFAQPGEAPADDERIDRMLDECIGDEIYPYGPQSCTFDSSGRLIGRSVPGELGPSGMFQTFVVVALLWAGIPLLIAGAVANSREESVGMALPLTLALGWIGLAIVLFGQHRTAEQTGDLVKRTGLVKGSPRRADPAERLRSLDELHAQGLISHDERDRRRGAVLEEL